MKIIIIGCPGAGKSVLTRRLNTFLNYPVMHLDKIYHTGGKNHIKREELIEEVNNFVEEHRNWIIDGNYISTLEMRVKLADTIILLNISSDICLNNVYERENSYIKSGTNRDDMAKEFDGRLTDDFVSFVKNFEVDSLPKIKNILANYRDKNIKEIVNYDEIEVLIEAFKNK